MRDVRKTIPSGYFQIKEAAAHIEVSPETIRKAIKDGKLQPLRWGKRFLIINKDDLEAFNKKRLSAKILPTKCEICGKDISKRRDHAGGLAVCTKHKNQYEKYGKFLDSSPRTHYDPNEFHILDDRVIIDLYDCRGNKISEAIIDVEDFHKVKNEKWHLSGPVGGKHVMCGQPAKGTEKRLAHVVFGMTQQEIDEGYVIDHRSGDPLDNRKANLRKVRQFHNTQNLKLRKNNSSGFSGVTYREKQNGYDCYIQFKWHRVHFGIRPSIEEAVYARLIAEELVFKDKARQDEHLEKIDFTAHLPYEMKERIRSEVIDKLQQEKVIGVSLDILPDAEYTGKRILKSTNKSGYTGVTKMQNNDNWRICFKLNGKVYNVHNFLTKKEAVYARLLTEKLFNLKVNEEEQANKKEYVKDLDPISKQNVRGKVSDYLFAKSLITDNSLLDDLISQEELQTRSFLNSDNTECMKLAKS